MQRRRRLPWLPRKHRRSEVAREPAPHRPLLSRPSQGYCHLQHSTSTSTSTSTTTTTTSATTPTCCVAAPTASLLIPTPRLLTPRLPTPWLPGRRHRVRGQREPELVQNVDREWSEVGPRYDAAAGEEGPGKRRGGEHAQVRGNGDGGLAVGDGGRAERSQGAGLGGRETGLYFGWCSYIGWNRLE